MKRVAIWLILFPLGACAGGLPLNDIQLPQGFRIELVARVPNAREMALGDHGTLFVGSFARGEVYALRAGSREPLVIAHGLANPIGVAFRGGALYVSAVSRILRYDDIEARLEAPPQPVDVRGDLPTETWHGAKFIAFGPDGRLYVPVGFPCNVCEKDPRRYGGIFRMRPDGGRLELYATGIRNSVGFDWNPQTGSLWFTNNGRDMMGDDVPPDTLNRAPRPGMNFGFPYCHAGDIPDPQFGRERACADFSKPAMKLGAHVAPLGMRFYTGTQFPPAYRSQIFIAEHGSWNRSTKVGYRVTLVTVKDDAAVSYAPFATGWLQGESAWGRPADVLVAPDGALLVSDDLAGAIYRISYAGG
ncbi:MAG TPA: PQQ-dependent sugar dehydrogenase [Burkholderiales bacterium]|nr:PQQ-dependent sugar dehydrogenase [Burkholderiales bacterium]